MGSRGAFSPSYGKTGGIPIEKRGYSVVGVLGRIKIIQCDMVKNNPTTTYSNTRNTTYYSFSKENHKIEHIYYFRNHKLVKSIDLNNGEPHVHFWNSIIVGRKKHDKRNIFKLSDRDNRLANQALEYNKKQKNEQENY